MSEIQQVKTDDAVQATTPIADIAGQPPLGPKKSPLIAIIAIIVVIALIATAFSVLIMGGQPSHPELTVKVVPMSVAIANGSQIRLTPYAIFKNSSSDAGTNVSDFVSLSINCKWSTGSAQIGTLTRGKTTAGLAYYMLKSNMVGTSSLNWSFKYVDTNLVSYNVYKKVNVNVSIAALSYIEINPAEKVILKGKSQLFTARAILTNDTEVSADYSWSLSDPILGTITPLNESSTTWKAGLINASGELVCNGTYLGKTVSSTANVKIIPFLPPPSTKSMVYNLLSVPLGGWWADRYQEKVVRSTFPVAYEWFGTPAGNTFLYSSCSLNVVAKNISKVNTSEMRYNPTPQDPNGDNPWYVPILNPTVKGGNIEIDWIGTYLTKAQAISDYQESIADWYDSWFWRFNGTVTMDKTAAKMVMNMTEVEFKDFSTWKADKFPAFAKAYSLYIQNQMNIVWAIKFAYEYEGNTLYELYDIEKVGDKIVFKIVDHLSWGAESLLGRWWRDTFLQFEGWPDDMHFKAKIGPLVSNFTLDMTAQYFITAMNSTRDGRTSWVLDTQRADAVSGTFGSYRSEFNAYYGKKVWTKLIANSNYLKFRDFDYTPTAWSLGTNDSLVVNWSTPTATSPYMGYNQKFPNGTNNVSLTVSGKISPLWIEPIPGEVPSNLFISNSKKTITILGPFDATQWSKTTLAGRELRENWSRLKILPQGVPRIEFVVNNDANLKPTTMISAPRMWGLNTPLTLKSASYDVDSPTLTYDWYLGNGQGHASTRNVTHTWTAEDNYTVILNVSDGTSTTSDRIVIDVRFNMPPTADLNDSLRYGSIQEAMVFNGDGSFDVNLDMDNSTIVSYEWDFGDGNTSITTTSRTSHLYADMGIYNVTLTVVDNLGATDSDTVLFVITVDLCAKIVMQRSATVGDTVNLLGNRSFTFSASHGKTLANWSWDFGDGANAYTQNVSHAWSSAGIFTVTLFVKDNAGLKSLNTTAKIVIAAATVSGIGLSLGRHSLLPGESTALKIKVVNDAGKVVTGFTGNVVLAVNGSGWTLASPITFVGGDLGVKTVTVSCATPGSYNITASVQGTPSQNGSIFATVNTRTVETTVYNIFQGTLPDYWARRSVYYQYGDEGFHNSSPVIEIFRATGAPKTAGQLSTFYVMKVEARNIPEINMSSPTYTALLNPTTGLGTANVTLDYHMMTDAEVNAGADIYYPAIKVNSWDGWEYFLTCSIVMNRSAAEQIINLPATWVTQGDVDAWWATYNLTTKNLWNRLGYLGAEGGQNSPTVVIGRLDLRSSEDGYSYGQGLWSSQFRLVYNDPEHVTLSYWNVGYGYDALLARFMYWGGPGSGPNYPNGTPNGIVPFEPWYDNMSLKVNIDDDQADLTMYGTVAYGFRAWTSDFAPADTAAFRWEIIRLDYLLSASGGLSEMDIYQPTRDPALDPTYLLRDPGSNLYGRTVVYDYVPAVITLKPGESIFMQAPRELSVGYLPKPYIGDKTDPFNGFGGYYSYLRVIEVFGNATIHPIGCLPGTYSMDKAMGDLTLVGPFVPIIKYRSDITWLVDEPAPRIELWIQ